jgi:glycosyltransferase involved in cell wall biosynthesis
MLLAVVLCSFNNQSTINRSIDSVLKIKKKLTNWNIKILIVDDASNDKTVSIIKEYKKNNKDITVKIFKENKGVSRSRNYGIKNSLNSDYLLFLDADDELDFKFINFLKFNNLDADIYSFDFTIISDNEKKLVTHLNRSKNFELKAISNYFSSYLIKPNRHSMFVTCWAKLFKTSIIDKNNIYFKENMNIYEDAEFIFRFLRSSKTVHYIKLPSYNYYVPNLKNRATFGINWNVTQLFSFIVALRQLRFFLINIGNNPIEVDKKIFHCMGAYSCISSTRAWLRVKNFNEFIKIQHALSVIYKKSLLKKVFRIYDAQLAGGNLLATFMVKHGFYKVAAILFFISSKLRY